MDWPSFDGPHLSAAVCAPSCLSTSLCPTWNLGVEVPVALMLDKWIIIFSITAGFGIVKSPNEMYEGPWCGTFAVGKTDTAGINGWLSRSYASDRGHCSAATPARRAGRRCRECPPSLPACCADPFHSPSRLHRHPAPISHYRGTHLTPPTRPAPAPTHWP